MAFASAHVRGVQFGLPQTPDVPPPPHVSSGGHVPQLGIKPPQPSAAGPHLMLAGQACGVHEVVPHMLGPAPPHVMPVGHGPQSIVAPQPSGIGPHDPPAGHVAFVQGGVTQAEGVPVQISPVGHDPQSSCFPQPSLAGPQAIPAHVPGTHGGGGGGVTGTMHEVRSKIMYARIFSCALIEEPPTHSFGNVVPFVLAPTEMWKSL